MKSIINNIIKCKICGSKIFIHNNNTTNRISHIVKNYNICYECAFWQNIIKSPPKYLEVLGDKCLRVLPPVNNTDKSMMLGGKGKMRYFLKPDMSVLKSNDIWAVGIVPERFKKNFKPTVREITKKAYNRLKNNNKKCKARACMDRYFCWRYNVEQEKTLGAYNTVPPTWIKGGERCKSFIGFDDILSE